MNNDYITFMSTFPVFRLRVFHNLFCNDLYLMICSCSDCNRELAYSYRLGHRYCTSKFVAHPSYKIQCERSFYLILTYNNSVFGLCVIRLYLNTVALMPYFVCNIGVVDQN